MRTQMYTLNAQERPVEEPDPRKWAVWMGRNKHALSFRAVIRKGVEVSTTFLGLDHNHDENGSPVLWETMVFGGVCDGDTTRYRSADESRAGHLREVARVKAAEKAAQERLHAETDAAAWRMLVSSPRFQKMTVAEAVAEMRANGAAR